MVIYLKGEVLPGIPGTTGELIPFLPGGNPPAPYETSVGRGENNTLGIIFERGELLLYMLCIFQQKSSEIEHFKII